jgi:hypothetical protein
VLQVLGKTADVGGFALSSLLGYGLGKGRQLLPWLERLRQTKPDLYTALLAAVVTEIMTGRQPPPARDPDQASPTSLPMPPWSGV